MTLHLVELQPEQPERDAAAALVERAEAALRSAGARLLEAHVPRTFERIFLIAELPGEAPSADAVGGALLEAGIAFDDVAQVRLVGAEIEEVRKLAGSRPVGYLVEWDLPEGLSMDAYLARKKEKAPLYAQVPETTFLRTYVREDMDKCLCLYDAPDEEAVKRAREAVDTPIDRLHALGELR
ncbi:hypothetical protein Acsp03_39850 [Actinomadura sp. NBRC 104412]|uniref:DUF4242 domain-containing protein n=1 Tax=Actinomadura sp. NBRC 104412 TaxID=3032203 RepID=UPI00249FA3E5|nr:nickel-binding protein [Actinomadura sp. NBRC 104412]GLZ06519.1 hypothetical protein Acsp03_39850 [Actinomadura sp. NBRC 104412]